MANIIWKIKQLWKENMLLCSIWEVISMKNKICWLMCKLLLKWEWLNRVKHKDSAYITYEMSVAGYFVEGNFWQA